MRKTQRVDVIFVDWRFEWLIGEWLGEGEGEEIGLDGHFALGYFVA